MTEPIDIIIPWVNPNDETWRKDFLYWKERETGDKQDGRFRDCNTLKYVLRSIDENCPWCRYVFLVLSGPSQIPSWLNVNCQKLKIVYHKDYIPAEYLPTFNTNVIEIFYSNIKELSENFILCNDDTFFCQKKESSFYFKDGLPLYKLNRINGFGTDLHQTQLKNSKNVASEIAGADVNAYSTFHLPVQFIKSVNAFCLYKIGDKMKSYLGTSKFRTYNDILQNMFYYVTIALHKFKETNENKGMFYYFNNKKNKFNMNFPMVCLNESGDVDNEDIAFLEEQLKNKFKKKSNFEF